MVCFDDDGTLLICYVVRYSSHFHAIPVSVIGGGNIQKALRYRICPYHQILLHTTVHIPQLLDNSRPATESLPLFLFLGPDAETSSSSTRASFWRAYNNSSSNTRELDAVVCAYTKETQQHVCACDGHVAVRTQCETQRKERGILQRERRHRWPPRVMVVCVPTITTTQDNGQTTSGRHTHVCG